MLSITAPFGHKLERPAGRQKIRSLGNGTFLHAEHASVDGLDVHLSVFAVEPESYDVAALRGRLGRVVIAL